MSLKKNNASQLSRDDIVRVLDMEETNLSAEICSKLRQNRYKAIDHAGIIDKRDYMRVVVGWAVASVACVGLISYLVDQHSVNQAIGIPKDELAKESVPTANGVSRVDPLKEKDAVENDEANSADDNKPKEEDAAEDLEIYEWLYNNYG